MKIEVIRESVCYDSEDGMTHFVLKHFATLDGCPLFAFYTWRDFENILDCFKELWLYETDLRIGETLLIKCGTAKLKVQLSGGDSLHPRESYCFDIHIDDDARGYPCVHKDQFDEFMNALEGAFCGKKAKNTQFRSV